MQRDRGSWLSLCAACALAAFAGGCTSVKFVQKNPWTGEIWTVYTSSLGSDSITYCPPTEGGICREATFVSGPPPQQPTSATPSTPQ